MTRTTRLVRRAPRRAIALGLGAALALAACGDDGGVDRQEGIDAMVDAGFTEDEASCIVDRVIDEIGEDKIEADADLSDDDTAKMVEIVSDCTDVG